jgi:hypothetical protein
MTYTKSHAYKLVSSKIGPPRAWPRAISDIVFHGQEQLSRDEIFKVTVFFMANGLKPREIRQVSAALFPENSEIDEKEQQYIMDEYPAAGWTAWNVKHSRSVGPELHYAALQEEYRRGVAWHDEHRAKKGKPPAAPPTYYRIPWDHNPENPYYKPPKDQGWPKPAMDDS